MSVGTTDNETVVRRDIEEVWSSDGDLDSIDDTVTDDFVYHTSMMDINGRDEYREMAEETRKMFSDFDMEVEDILSSDDEVVVRYTMRGTNTGEMMGKEPTNERIEMTGIIIDRLEDGKIRERYENADELGMLVQLGVVELPPEMREFEE
ncbi:ester cyclase [Haladaptatus sp. CMAA 1911]|uniref:ester cyclase n=1 Tax=unclassified Haladaptatus TaxID=2622732 RepID=UPI003755386E